MADAHLSPEPLDGGVIAATFTPPFVARERELEAVAAALATDRHVLLFGEGGVGKTTLVRHLVDRLQEQEESPVVEFSFHGGVSPAVLAHDLEVFLTTGIQTPPAELLTLEWPERDWIERLPILGRIVAGDGFADLTLVVENVEVVEGFPSEADSPYSAAERAAVRAFFAACLDGPVRLLFTSRRNEGRLLGVGARFIELGGVAPEAHQELLQAYCTHFESYHAFDAGNDDDRAALLALLAGHPLATRMAAFALGHRRLSEVVAGIRGRLTDQAASAARHPSAIVGALLAVCLDALPDARRLAILLMGLLRGTFWEGNFVGMAAGEECPAHALQDRSEEALHAALVSAGEIGLVYPNEERPYILHTLPAAFDTLLGLSSAQRDGDLGRALEEYVLRYWASTADALRTQGLPDADRLPDILAFCGVEEGNLRRALEIAERDERWEEARPLLFILLNVWNRTSRGHDATRLREHWLGLISNADGNPRDPDNARICDLWRFLWGNHANWLLSQKKYAEAEAIHRRVAAEEEGRDEPDETVLGGIYFQIARTYEDREMWAEAEEWQKKSLKIRTRLTDPHGMAACHHQLGLIAMGRQQFKQATRHFDEAIAIRERAEDVPGQAASYLQSARALREVGAVDKARDNLSKAIEAYGMRGDKPLLATAYQQMASLHFSQGALDDSEAAAKQAMEIRNDLGDMVGMAANAGQLARVEAQRDNPAAALRWLLQAFGLLSQAQSPQATLAAAQIRRLRETVGADRFAPIWQEVAEDRPMPPWLAN